MIIDIHKFYICGISPLFILRDAKLKQLSLLILGKPQASGSLASNWLIRLLSVNHLIIYSQEFELLSCLRGLLTILSAVPDSLFFNLK